MSLHSKGTIAPISSATIQPISKTVSNEISPKSNGLPIIDLQKKSKYGDLLDSVRVRSEYVPLFNRKHTYKVRHKLMDVLPIEKRLVLKSDYCIFG